MRFKFHKIFFFANNESDNLTIRIFILRSMQYLHFIVSFLIKTLRSFFLLWLCLFVGERFLCCKIFFFFIFFWSRCRLLFLMLLLIISKIRFKLLIHNKFLFGFSFLLSLLICLVIYYVCSVIITVSVYLFIFFFFLLINKLRS